VEAGVRPRDPDTRKGIFSALKAAFDVVVAEPVPECFDATLKRLENKK
jgi:hypothetical protein